jgi:hypothetical protein
MAKFIFTRDEERSQEVANFTARLISVSPEPVGQFPSGKEYHVGTIQFENDKGQVVQRTCIINKANFDKGMSEGNDYLCNAIIRDGQSTVLLVCSHLQGGSARADFSDFGVGTTTSTSTPVVNANPLAVA